MDLILSGVVISFFLLVIAKLLWKSKKSQSLENTHVLITGGSSGIGKCVAIEAAKRGANVTIVARNVSQLEAAQSEIIKHCTYPEKQTVQYISLDVSCNYSKIEQAFHEAEDNSGPVYMLVNCAGIAICGRVEDISTEDAECLMNVNFFGTFYPIKALISRMKSRKEGKIVIVSSMASFIGIYGFGVYSATKFALRGFAEALDMEVGPYNISVTVCFPPDTDTPGLERENKSKPLETRLISQSGGLYKPNVVAERIMKDALNGKFFSTVGFDGWILITGCPGMAPVSTAAEFLKQVFLAGILRAVAICYLFTFHRIIRNCMKNKDKTKKSE